MAVYFHETSTFATLHVTYVTRNILFFLSKWTQVVLGLKLSFIACDDLKISGISDKPILAQTVKKRKHSNRC